MTKDLCFVMQPFDRGKFDDRYEDVFAPALEKCGLEPYRVDRDPGVSIPIDEIENSIRNARICFAEITTDNPNVWFELGYAIACSKDVVLVCASERKTAFPFDVRHRNIITYESNSARDFEKLEADIVVKTKAILAKQTTVDTTKTDLITTEDLSDHEIIALVTIMVDQMSGEGIAGWDLQKEMKRKGYNEIATTIAVKKLLTKSMIKQSSSLDHNGYEYNTYLTTSIGEDWVIQNEGKILLKSSSAEELSDELPF
jgi:hypothetical protein